MTIQEYLRQAYLLDFRINAHIEQAEELRELATSLSSPSLGDRVQSCPDGNAPFVKQVESIIRLENKINAEIDTLVALKEQIQSVISTVSNPEEYRILQYRYIDGLSCGKIARKMHMARSSVYRHHDSAISKLRLPENPIILGLGNNPGQNETK